MCQTRSRLKNERSICIKLGNGNRSWVQSEAMFTTVNAAVNVAHTIKSRPASANAEELFPFFIIYTQKGLLLVTLDLDSGTGWVQPTFEAHSLDLSLPSMLGGKVPLRSCSSVLLTHPSHDAGTETI
jgi:hypothetical protein